MEKDSVCTDSRFRLPRFGGSCRRLWVEVGTDLLTCVVTERQGDKIRTTHRFLKAIEGTADSREYLRTVRQTLAKVLSEHGLRGIKTICVILGEDVRTLPLSFPQMPSSELRKAVGLSLVGKLKMSQKETCFDFHHARRTTMGKEVVDVIAVAAKREDIQTTVETLENAGCVVQDVTVALTQYGKLIRANAEEGKHGPTLVIDIGRESSRFISFDGDVPRYCRKEQKLGERQMLSAVDLTISVGTGTLRLTEEEAKKVIRKYGIAHDSGEDQASGKKMPLFQLHSMLRPYAEWMVAMTRNALLRHVKAYGPPEVESIFLTGRGAYMNGLAEHVQKALGVPTAVLLPTQSLTCDGPTASWQEDEAAFSGLAAVAAAPPGEISLLPRSAKVNRLVTIGTRLGTVFFLLLLALLVVFRVGIGWHTRKHDELLSGMKRFSAPEADMVKTSQHISQMRKRTLWYENAMREVSPPHRWVGILGDVARLVPSNMTLEKITFSRSQSESVLELQGKACVPVEAGKESAFEFATLLKSSPFVDTVLQVSQREGRAEDTEPNTMRFEIRCRLRTLPSDLNDCRLLEIESEKGREL